jgi:flagellum-specific peptidoglycan hydrolase FlgJ
MVKFEIYRPVRPALVWTAYLLSRYGLKFGIILLGVYLLVAKDVSVQVALKKGGIPEATVASNDAHLTSNAVTVTPLNEGVLFDVVDAVTLTNGAIKPKWEDRTANTFSNVGFVLNPTYATRNKVDPNVVAHHMGVCKQYIKHFAKTAIMEQQKFGIPASITLAQGLLESNAGESRLAMESNNHFGIKCKSKCKGCTCRNYTDDSVYDMFRVFESNWESFRAHSELLMGERYKGLHRLKKTDYESWAYGLKKAGYATDPRYAEKLIALIEYFQLYRFDNMTIK